MTSALPTPRPLLVSLTVLPATTPVTTAAPTLQQTARPVALPTIVTSHHREVAYVCLAIMKMVLLSARPVLHLCDLRKFIVMYFMCIHKFSKSNFGSMPMRFWLSWYWIFYLHFLCCIYWCSILCYMHAIFYVRNDVEYDRVLVLHMLACPSMPDLFGRVLPQWIILCSLCSILLNITSPVSCTSCAPTFIIMNGMCICDIGFYASPVLNICMLCSSSMVGCLECINEIQCTACDLSNYFML